MVLVGGLGKDSIACRTCWQRIIFAEVKFLKTDSFWYLRDILSSSRGVSDAMSKSIKGGWKFRDLSGKLVQRNSLSLQQTLVITVKDMERFCCVLKSKLLK